MGDPTGNDPAVFRRVKQLLLVGLFIFLFANARTSFAKIQYAGLARHAVPAQTEGLTWRAGVGGILLGLSARFDEPDLRSESQLPLTEQGQEELPFPALKLPVPAGVVHIPKDGGYTNALLHLRGDYDQYALDMCEGDNCTRLGRHTIAPTNISYEFSSPYAIGYHFFEVYDDGQEKVCMSLGHFNWPVTIYPSGAPEPGTHFPQGAVLGELSWWGEMPHVHMGLWTMPSKTPTGVPVKCHYWNVPRQPQPFTGKYKLDGVEYPECWPHWYSCYGVHAGRQLVSTNAPFSYIQVEEATDYAGIFYEAEEARVLDRRMTPAKTGDA